MLINTKTLIKKNIARETSCLRSQMEEGGGPILINRNNDNSIITRVVSKGQKLIDSAM